VNAVTNLDVTQTYAPEITVNIEQNCSDGLLCLEHASPIVNVTSTQDITATAENLLQVTQDAISGSQAAALSGSALTVVAAQQILTPEVTMTIAQDCSIDTGACVQTALPIVEALARQIIEATANNTFEITQQMESGSLQTADVNVEAATSVQAEQIVNTTAVVELVQKCKVDLGLCIQDAAPLLRSLAEQVVNVQAENNVLLTQSGALEQITSATGSSATLVDAMQDNTSDFTVTVVQECDVTKGLCIQSQNGLQQYVFSDGETIEAGEYVGVLDDHALDAGYNRQTVATVAMGICPEGKGMCPKVQQLLVWLFGPEPEAEPESAEATESAVDSNDTSEEGTTEFVKRGHETNRIGGILRFYERTIRNAADGRVVTLTTDIDSGLDTRTVSLICQIRKAALDKKTPDVRMRHAMRLWAAQEISKSTGRDQVLIQEALLNRTLCTEKSELAQKKLEASPVIAFPVDATGPVSSNTLWNRCVRGDYITYDDIRANPDRDPRTNRPRSCGNYHTKNDWYHPDLAVRFTWDYETRTLVLPVGYVAIPQSQHVALEEDVMF
jgi:hypothetical protein